MAQINKSLIDFQGEWENLVNKAFTDYNNLSVNERIWYNIQTLIGDVNNGGLISHYYNHGADKNKETIEDLKTLGFSDIAGLLEQVNTWFPDKFISTDINKRNEVINNWPEGKYDDLLVLLDKNFYDKEKDLEKSLVQHIETKVLVNKKL